MSNLAKSASRPVWAVCLVAVLAVVAATLASTLSLSARASAASVTPTFVQGNPTCQELGFSYSFKVDPPNSGTYTVTNSVGTLGTVTVTSDGTYFDWTSTFGIDAVIAKGGPNANLYVYDPPTESFGDTGLHSPINPNNDRPFGLSHIEFCYDISLQPPTGSAGKTAETSLTRTYSWTIDKSVTPASHRGFTGDSFTSNYSVVVDQTTADSNWVVAGQIFIYNPAPVPVNFSVSDTLGDGTVATVSCPTNTVAAGGTVTCTYSASVTSGASGTNTATITSHTPGIGGFTTEAVPYSFENATVTPAGNPTINVMDSVEGSLGIASGDTTFSYSNTFTCDGDEGDNPNTATIVETQQFDSATVTVDCYELNVTKTATTSYDKTWTWTISKTGDQTSLALSPGQSFLVNYDVVVSAISSLSNYVVAGEIRVHNPAPTDATLNSVSDVVSPGINATVNCGVTFPYALPAGQTLVCTYTAQLPNGNDRTNTATATLQNTPSGTTNFTGSANIVFGATPTHEIDECVDVTDDKSGNLGTVCASESPKTFEYTLTVGPYTQAECGIPQSYRNVASFTTNDTAATGSDEHTVNITVSCTCTLTQGYWKTHSHRGPAPYDNGWLAIGSLGADTPFFGSGKTYYQVLWTPPAGNAYYNLAHQYIAAKLNILNGSQAPANVLAAISDAEALFNAQGAGDTTLSASERRTALTLASLLDQYNNGIIGPGHCSE